MNFLQSLLDNSSVPVITAFILGILTAVSPCPLATNITAIGFISKDIDNHLRRFIIPLHIWQNSDLYHSWLYPYSYTS